MYTRFFVMHYFRILITLSDTTCGSLMSRTDRPTSPDLETDLSSNLESQADRAREMLCNAGCTPLARVRAARGVMDLVFLTTRGASLLIRCSTRASTTEDAEALGEMHQQRTFDHVVLLTKRADQAAPTARVISFSELSDEVPDLANLQPGWAT